MYRHIMAYPLLVKVSYVIYMMNIIKFNFERLLSIQLCCGGGGGGGGERGGGAYKAPFSAHQQNVLFSADD